MTIGEKIKKRRLSLGLTQNRVAGDFISRNMLSLIENGSATPSLDTLSYLAEKLDIPIEYLVSQNPDPAPFYRIHYEQEIIAAFQEKKYDETLNLIENYGQNNDILARLAAEAAYNIAKNKVSGGSLKSGKEYLALAEKYIKQTSLDTKVIEAHCALLSSIVENIQSPKLNFNEERYRSLICEATNDEFFRYYCGEYEYPYKNQILSLHAMAKIEMRRRSYLRAIELLNEAEETKTAENYDAFVFLGIYTDLESCYKEIGDFEKAYRYASKRISMMEYFKS